MTSEMETKVEGKSVDGPLALNKSSNRTRMTPTGGDSPTRQLKAKIRAKKPRFNEHGNSRDLAIIIDGYKGSIHYLVNTIRAKIPNFDHLLEATPI